MTLKASTQLLQQLVAYETCRLGKVKFHQGDLVAAAKFLGQSKTHCEAVGSPWISANTLCQSGHVWQAGGEYQKSAHAYAESIKTRQALTDVIGLAECLLGCAGLAVTQHDFESTGQLQGACAALYESSSGIMPAWERREFERLSTQVRSSVGDDVIAKGRHLPTTDAVELAKEALAAIGRSQVSPT
ncbi:MAG: hypothetical protein HW407_1702 [Bacteroidetes bacterium]|nr:hypothetical protein [Bacteroidota bacterium]